MPSQSEQDEQKRAAASWAVAAIEDGMIVGLGSGSTAEFAVKALAARIATGLRVEAIPTSEKTATLARQLGVPLTSFAAHRRIDITIDGADQVARGSLDLIKGLGGALLREKIVASVSDRMLVVVDATKLADRLGGTVPLPVEIVKFGWEIALDRLAALGCTPRLRLAEDRPFITDGGNYIADCTFAEIEDPVSLAAQLSAMVGIVEHGLFRGMACQIVVGRLTGVEVIDRRNGV